MNAKGGGGGEVCIRSRRGGTTCSSRIALIG